MIKRGEERIHIPVLSAEVLSYLNPRHDGIYIDGTVGDGGHAKAICSYLGSGGMLIGLDHDAESLQRARNNLKKYNGLFILIKDNFANIKKALAEAGYDSADGILLDLGIASNQVDDPDRGFSYKKYGPLDMRMDKDLTINAADIVNKYSQKDLSRVLKIYGEEKWAVRIAGFIVKTREKKEIATTEELVDIIRAAVPVKARQKGKHPARRCFQALRIEVNKELDQLKNALPQCLSLLKKNGTLCVISYHSLEDRIVKNFMRLESDRCLCPPGLPQCVCDLKENLQVITRKPVKASEDEVIRNPRSRSALLRVARKN